MTLPRIYLLALASVAFATSLFADTVVLKDGTKIEGKITNETDTQVTIETRAGGIVDEQTFKKDEVQSVSKATADEVAYASLRNIKIGANSLPTPAQYDTIVASLKAFVSQHPTSKYKAEVEKLANEFEAERTRVAEGEVKMDGKWISKDEVQRERYQINGMVAFNYMKEQAARNDAIGALNTFEILKKQYPGSRGYIEAVEVVKRLVPSLKQQADARLAKLPAEIAEREKAVAGAAGANKIQLQGELDRIKQGNAAAMANAKRQGLRWPPFIPQSEDSMKEISQLAGDEASQLASIQVAKGRQSIQLTTEARAAMEKKDFTAAEEKLRLARDAWPENEVIARLEPEVTAGKAAAEAKAAAKSEEPAPAATDKPAEAEAAPAESTDTTASTESATAEEEGNPLFRIVLIVVIAIVAFVGFSAYRKIRKKSNEVIE